MSMVMWLESDSIEGLKCECMFSSKDVERGACEEKAIFVNQYQCLACAFTLVV